MKRQYKSIDEINKAQKEMHLQCRKIEADALNFVTSPTGLLTDIGLGLISKKNIFRKKKQAKPNTLLKEQSQKLSTNNTSKNDTLLSRAIRYASKVFIKYQLLNIGIWASKQLVKKIKKQRQLKQIEKASKELDTLIAQKQLSSTSK